MADLARYREASNDVLTRGRQRQTTPDYSRSKKLTHYCLSHMMQIQMAANKLHLLFCFSLSHMVYDNYRRLFQDIVAASPKVIPMLVGKPKPDRQQNPFTFHFMISILPSLTATVYFCRFQPERDQALAYLEQIYTEANDYKEGVWDIKVVYPHAKRIRDLEEAERDPDTGAIPEEKRMCFADADVNIAKRRVVWRLWQGVGRGRKLITHTFVW
jgi:hypothetical protein